MTQDRQGALTSTLALTWSLRRLLGGRILALSLDGGRVQDPRGGAVLTEVVLQAFDGAVQLVGPDLEVHVHEICNTNRLDMDSSADAGQLQTQMSVD